MRKDTNHLQRRQHSEGSASQSFWVTFSLERKRPGEEDGRELDADGEGEEGAPSLLRGCCGEVGAVDEPDGAESGPIRSDDGVPYVHWDGDHIPDFGVAGEKCEGLWVREGEEVLRKREARGKESWVGFGTTFARISARKSGL
jgi:hypothetical protein